jgi:hypothetical protein
MYIHAGAGKIVRGEDIIGVFDMDGHTGSDVNAEFLKRAEREGVTEAAGNELPRSFIVLTPRSGERSRERSRSKERVVFSRISVNGVRGRGESAEI